LRSAGEWSEGEAEQTTLFSGMIGRSRAMHDIFRLIGNLQHSEATILITGESGTGKELVAHAIHEHSPRAAGPFVAVNSGAIPSELLESELFGHVKGAFTGAIRDRMGRFELASPGTLFLDEIGDLPLPLQVKILRVLQERTFERVGESRSRRTEARIIAATNADLEEAVSMGSFREDLYYRLRVVPIRVSPLRQRREDVDPLARYLLERVGRRHGRALQLAPDAIRALMAYAWPGNVRELENALEYAVAVCRGQTIHPADLPEEIGGRAIQPAEEGPMSAAVVPEPADASPGQLQPSDSLLAEPPGDDAAALRAALEAHRWNRSATAEALGISRTTLWRRMRELGLLPDRS
jgi:DNA-binding NtrC family response regulator